MCCTSKLYMEQSSDSISLNFFYLNALISLHKKLSVIEGTKTIFRAIICNKLV